MKKLLLIFPFIFIGCSSVRWVTTDHGQIINDNRKPVNIIGNPMMRCYNSKNQLVADGYFVRQEDDGSFLIDEYGKRYVTVINPNCLLGPNDKN